MQTKNILASRHSMNHAKNFAYSNDMELQWLYRYKKLHTIQICIKLTMQSQLWPEMVFLLVLGSTGIF